MVMLDVGLTRGPQVSERAGRNQLRNCLKTQTSLSPFTTPQIPRATVSSAMETGFGFLPRTSIRKVTEGYGRLWKDLFEVFQIKIT